MDICPPASPVKSPSLLGVFIILLLFLAVILTFTLKLSLPIQLSLLLLWLILGAYGITLRHSYHSLQEAVIQGIHGGLVSLLILIVVGALIGTWIAGGVVPALIYYGLKLIDPALFLSVTVIVCSVTSLAIGTSWGTAGTVGMALMGVGHGLGIPAPITAGAVLSGAYFGDKLSPLSDSTILASTMAKVDLMKHIKALLIFDIPSIALTTLLFSFYGFQFQQQAINLDQVNFLTTTLEHHFTINLWMLMPPLIVMSLLALHLPAIPVLAVGAALGVLWSIIFQGSDVTSALNAIYSGFHISSEDQLVDSLLNRGGMHSMLDSVLVIILGLGLGGLLESLGVLQVLADKVLKNIYSFFSVTVVTILSGIITNIFGCAMYVSLILTPKMMQRKYDELKINRIFLSRNTEVGGTLVSGMVPWSDNGIYMTMILGVGTLEYLPYMWYSFVAIIITIIFSYFSPVKNYASVSSKGILHRR